VGHPLDQLNLTELIQLCREAGLGSVGRATPREQVYAALDEGARADCPLEERRETMEAHIRANYRRLRTQLPGCNGKCTTFGCPDLIVQRCWNGLKDDIL